MLQVAQCPQIDAKELCRVFVLMSNLAHETPHWQLWPVLQVAERIRTDPRVVVVDRTNLRYLQLQDLPGDAVPVDLISLDLSFISVLKVMPVVCELLRPGGVLIVLVKPQFEASREQVTHTSLLRTLPTTSCKVVRTRTVSAPHAESTAQYARPSALLST